MSKQLLNDAQVGSALQEVRRKRVAQGVGADPVLETGRPGCRDQHLPGTPPVESVATDRKEQRAAMPAVTVPGLAARDLPALRFVERLARPARPNFLNVAAEPDDGHLTHRNLTLAVALADDPHESFVEVDVVAVQADSLGDAQARGIEQLE